MKISLKQYRYIMLVCVLAAAILTYFVPGKPQANMPILTDNTTEFMDKLNTCYKYPERSSDRYLCVKSLVDSIAPRYNQPRNFEPVIVPTVPEFQHSKKR